MPDFSQATDFVVRVLDGPLVTRDFGFGAPGVLRLRGRALPYRPITYEGAQRVVTTWYQGSPAATQQIIGPEERPTTISGVWKDRFLGDRQASSGGLGGARHLAETFDLIRAQGASVEVSWSSFVRVGIITRFKAMPERPQDVGFEVEFTWRARTSIPPLRAMHGILQATTVARDLQAVAAELAEVFEVGTGFDLPTFGVQLSAESLLNLAALEMAVAVAPLESAWRELAAGTTAESSSSSASFGQLAEQVESETIPSASRLGLGVQRARKIAVRTFRDDALHSSLHATWVTRGDDLSDVLSFALLRRAASRRLVREAVLATNQADVWEEQLRPAVLLEVEIREGDDLRHLAARHYGSSELWTRIADFNDLEGSSPPVGTVVLVPRADLLQSSGPRPGS